jgi:hypothetical protein
MSRRRSNSGCWGWRFVAGGVRAYRQHAEALFRPLLCAEAERQLGQGQRRRIVVEAHEVRRLGRLSSGMGLLLHADKHQHSARGGPQQRVVRSHRTRVACQSRELVSEAQRRHLHAHLRDATASPRLEITRVARIRRRQYHELVHHGTLRRPCPPCTTGAWTDEAAGNARAGCRRCEWSAPSCHSPWCYACSSAARRATCS